MKTAIIFSDHVIEVSVTFQFEGSKQYYSTRERAVCTERHKCLQLLHNYSKFHDNRNNNDSTIHNQFGTYIHIPTYPYKTKNRHTYHVKLFADRFSQATFHAKAVQECEKDVL